MNQPGYRCAVAIAACLAGSGTALAAQSFCLTGNATGESAELNLELEGRYTYTDGGTDAASFPYIDPHRPTGRVTNVDEPMLNGGWVPFNEGKLSDGDMQTRVGYPIYHQGSRGHDFIFDFGSDHAIDAVELHAVENHVRNISVFLRATNETLWTMVNAISDRVRFNQSHYPKLTSPQTLTVTGTAHQVRINACFEAGVGGFREILIWGRPIGVGDAPPQTIAFRQAGGKMTIEDPQEIPLPVPDRVCPIPRETIAGEGRFELTSQTTIAAVAGATDRTRRTAAVLAEDLRGETELEIKVVDAEDASATGIVLHPVGSQQDLLKDVGTQGYVLIVTPERIDIHGKDELGLFYATQTLLELITSDGDALTIPACTIRDWPAKTWRWVNANVPVTPGLIRALARLKVTHYETLHHQGSALKHSDFARDRMLELIPAVPFNWAWTDNPEAFIERADDEPLDSLFKGRRNPCPSHPGVWTSYFARIDRAVPIYGNYVNVNMDEMYQPSNGSRWNVCPRCRARNLTGHELMADTIETIRNYLHERGKKTMIIDSPFYSKGISHPDDEQNDWRKSAEILAARGIAADISVHVWHPNEVLQPLRKLGFPCLQYNRTAGRGALPDEYLGQYLAISDGPFQPQHAIGMVQRCWSPQHALPGSDPFKALVNAGMSRFNDLHHGRTPPSRRAGASFATIDLRPVANRDLTDDVPFDGRGFADFGANYDLRALKPGRRTIDGVPFEIIGPERGAVMLHNRSYYNVALPQRVTIPVGRKAAGIVFLHTLDDRASQQYYIKRELVGYYFMVYDDGTYQPLEIKYGINICNFDGLHTWWDFAPRGESMRRANLAWKGQMGCGEEAVLYTTEWTNPYLDKTIENIIFATTWKPQAANPILIAATAVTPTQSDLALAPQPAQLFKDRRVENLIPAKVTGTAIDLSNGRSESDHAWHTQDGITVVHDATLGNYPRSMSGSARFWSRAASAAFDNDRWTRCVARAGGSLTVTLPEARALSGLRFIGSYRREYYTDDHPPSMLNYEVFVSPDGGSWESVAVRELYIPEEEGPQWIPLGGRPLKAVRVHTRRHAETRPDYERGVALVELIAQ